MTISTQNPSNLIHCRTQVELLRRVSIFGHLPDHDLTELARRMTVKRWHAGAIIVAQSEPATSLYIVFRGRAKVVLFGESGREMTLSVLGPGDFFGETALLDGKPRAANLLAVDDTVVLVLDGETFRAHVKENPRTMLHLLSEMAGRLRRADELVGNLALHDVSSRLTRTLIAIGDEQGERRDEGIMIRHRPTQQDLANMVGTCRETVSRALSSMARRGLVVARGRSLLLRHELVESVRHAA